MKRLTAVRTETSAEPDEITYISSENSPWARTVWPDGIDSSFIASTGNDPREDEGRAFATRLAHAGLLADAHIMDVGSTPRHLRADQHAPPDGPGPAGGGLAGGADPARWTCKLTARESEVFDTWWTRPGPNSLTAAGVHASLSVRALAPRPSTVSSVNRPDTTPYAPRASPWSCRFGALAGQP